MPPIVLPSPHGAPALLFDRFDASDVETALVLRPTAPLGDAPDRAVLVEALARRVADARSRGHRHVTARSVLAADPLDAVTLAAWAAAVRDALSRAGFARTGERYDVTVDLADAAPWIATHDRGLSWAPLSLDRDEDLARAAEVMQRASRGDPESNDDEQALPTLRAMLSDDEYPIAHTRVAAGAVGGVDVAFAFAQRHAPTGIGRVTYVGVAPEARGRGLGRAAYARALSMLRDLQPSRYIGGTSSENRAMCALFDAVGARRTRTWSVWRRTP